MRWFCQYGCRWSGVDIAQEMLELAAKRAPSIDFRKIDDLRIPHEDGQFDLVYTVTVLHHNSYEAQQRIVAEMTRVLRPGGTFICSTPNIAYTAHPPYHLKEYRPEEFFALLERGYGVVERFGQYFKPIDRAQDLYQWHVRTPLVDAAARIGIKETLKKLLRGAPANPADYRVQPYRGPKWLRIMVAVAVKGR